jgi:hypothetical protein
MSKCPEEKIYSLSEARKIANISKRLAETIDHVVRRGYPLHTIPRLLDQMTEYPDVFRPQIIPYLHRLQENGRKTYNLENFLGSTHLD